MFAHLRQVARVPVIIHVCIMNDGDSVLWKEVSEWRNQTREQPEIASDFQVIRSFGVGENGELGVETKDTALGQLVGLCFNSDTMWQ